MIAQYDSRLGRAVVRGEHHGTPRVWVVQVRAEGIPDTLTFKPSGKVQLTDLSALVDSYLRQYGEEGVEIGRIRWTATAR